jgi:hypothetical protein
MKPETFGLAKFLVSVSLDNAQFVQAQMIALSMLA